MTGQTSIDAAKKALRARMTRLRGELGAETREAGARALAGIALDFLSPPSGAVISGYAAIGDELDPLALLTALSARGHAIALPVTIAAGAPLVFRAWSPGEALERGDYGVPAPSGEAGELTPEILLVPLLAFDARGHRLGYGAGYYDRTLARLRAKNPVIAIGLAFDAQRVDEVPHDEHDQPLDWVLTPSGPIGIESPEGMESPKGMEG